jgi:dihydrofolate reductase
MRKIIEYTLVSVDGVFSGGDISGFFDYRDDAYLRDGLGQLLACDAMLMGRNTYENFAKIWPGRTHPWADRINAIQKYVFSSKLEKAEWTNSTIVRGDVVAEVTRLKQQEGRDLLVYGLGLLGETLLRQHLLDVLDLSIYPLVVGQGKQFFREGEYARLTPNTCSAVVNGGCLRPAHPSSRRCGKVGGRAKDERLSSSRNATRLAICSPTTPSTIKPKSW